MHKVALESLFLVFMVLFVLLLSGITTYTSGNYYVVLPDKILLKTFLENQYVVGAGLLRAAKSVYSENITIYVANDNVLAARALAVLGSPLALDVFYVLYYNFSGGWNDKIDVLLGKEISGKFYVPYKEYIGRINGYIVLYEKMNKSEPINDWYTYADLLVYYGLNKLLMGSRSEAEKAFLNLTNMWDGYGFKDKCVEKHKVYNTYKCALFIYLYRALDAAGSKLISKYKYIYNTCLKILTMAQDPVFGGIYTSYRVIDNKIIILKGKEHDMNTETTSMVVLAIYSNYPEIIGSKDC